MAMKSLPVLLLLAGSACAGPSDDFLAEAAKTHGETGAGAARFLVEHMPERDRLRLSAELLQENLEAALKARTTFSWAEEVPESLFLNDVLPYAVLDERRERWRTDFLEKASAVVAEAGTATEAAQLLNRDFFNRVNVHYNTGRKRPNQSPSESMEQGKATCTGLSIILVYACRAVGIPARVVGTPMWANQRGNHTWVEFWDGDWHFLGADEYDPGGVDRGWFVADAARAREHEPRHAIYATSWKHTGLSFPMVWSRGDDSVPAVNVTSRYAGPAATAHELGVRLLDADGRRVAAEGVLTTPAGSPLLTFTTRGDDADLNDLPRVAFEPGQAYRLRFGDRETAVFVADEGAGTVDVVENDLAPVPDLAGRLSRELVPRATQLLYEALLETSRRERLAELEKTSIEFDGKELKWIEKTFGEAPADGRSLWISLHGGGGAPAEVNDRQWQNQAGLYEPEEGVYLAPRGPTDDWNLWHQRHIDPMFQRLIEDYASLRDVSPDKVYLLGYSAGGDGVWQLAPRMADRFAAAAMMAGHPNEASLLGLRNLPFAVFVGGEDAAYNRNRVAEEKVARLAELREEDPGGYLHLARIYRGLGHWMEGRDAEALPWMSQFARAPWPRRIVWFQDDVTHDRFYWLRLPDGAARQGQRIVAEVAGQCIALEGDVAEGTAIRLSDALVDLDEDVVVMVNGQQVFKGRVARHVDVLRRTLSERLDPAAAACAEVVLEGVREARP